MHEHRRAGAGGPTDVSDEAQVHVLAQRAADAFGRIDVWVNNAGVAIFGRFEEVPPEVYRRVIEVNLLGYINGARRRCPTSGSRAGGC